MWIRLDYIPCTHRVAGSTTFKQADQAPNTFNNTRRLILLTVDDSVQPQFVDVTRPSETTVYHTTCIPVCKFVFSFTWHLPGVGYHM
jgi:hypothetical protein